MMHRVASEIDVEQFRRDGATVLRNVVDDESLDLLAEGVEYNRTHPSEWSHWYTSPDEADRVLERLRHVAAGRAVPAGGLRRRARPTWPGS